MWGQTGFVPFGPLMGSPGTQFQPMYRTLNAVTEHVRWLRVLQEQRAQAVAA